MTKKERSETAKKAWRKIRAKMSPARRKALALKKQLDTKRRKKPEFKAASERAKKAWASRRKTSEESV